MKSLFAKVFGLLLAGFLLVSLVATLLFWWINNEINPRHQRLQENASRIAAEVIDAFEAGNLAQARRQIRQRHHMRFWLMDQDNKALDNRPLPPEILRQVVGYPTIVRPYQNKATRKHILAVESARDGRTYRVVMTTGRRPFRRDDRDGLIWGPATLLLLALVGASLLISQWVLKPLRIIRETAGTISEDNLHARVPAKVTGRRDAFGELGNEFNRMTSRLERSISGQQQLLRDISHELRTPLARIQVASSLAAQKVGGSTELDRIDSEIDRLNQMLESLLDLSRLRDRAELKEEPVDLADVIQQVADDAMFEFQDEKKRVETVLQHTIRPDGDAALLGQAIENVLRNALRYSRPQGVVLISSQDQDGYVCVTIEDDGPGVDPSQLEQIFDPFFQADTARTRGDGTDDSGQVGVGLALTRAIIRLHRGEIRAENMQTGGLRVTIRLPANRADAT